MTGDSRGRLRLFVALDLPAGAKAALAASCKELQGLLPAGMRWVNPAGIHLTLKFLGAVEAGRVDALLAALRSAAAAGDQPPFPLHLDGLGVFPNRREPRVIWAGVGGDLDRLAKMQRRVEQAMARLGFPEESRAFRPHLTLGRVRDGVAPAARRQIGEIITTQAAILIPGICMASRGNPLNPQQFDAAGGGLYPFGVSGVGRGGRGKLWKSNGFYCIRRRPLTLG